MTTAFQKYLAEIIGTAVLVFVGCASIVLSGFGGAFPIGILCIGLAFGMTVTAMAYTFGPVSGCHLNPSVTAAVWAAGRMNAQEAIGYIISQLIGGIVGALVLWLILTGKTAGYDVTKQGLGQTTWSDYGVGAAIVAEFIATLIFTTVILAVTGPKGSPQLAGLIIGITLMILHLAVINVSGTSVNAARSLGPALFAGGVALTQIWMYLIVPTVAGAVAGWLVRAKAIDV